MLTKEQKDRIAGAAYATFQYLSADILQMIVEAGEPARIDRDEAIEFALDAGRLEDQFATDLPELVEFRKLSYNEQIAVVKPAFRYARYS